MTTEMKPDNTLLVVSASKINGETKVELFPVNTTNLLTPQEAKDKGLALKGKPSKKKNVAVWCGLIASRFNEYQVITSTAEINDAIKTAEKSCEAERKRMWVSITRQLHKHSDEELNAHYERGSKEWRDWCADSVLWFAYNAVLFKKGVPIVEMNAQDKARAR